MGPKTPKHTRLARGGIKHLTLAATLTGAAMVPGLAIAKNNCGAIIKTLQAKESESQSIHIKDLFSFESSISTMGFQSERKIIKPTDTEISNIIKAAGQDSANLIAVAREMKSYFNSLPISSVGFALDLVVTRSRLKVSPEDMLSAYLFSHNLALRTQRPELGESFTKNTSEGVVHEQVVTLAMLKLSNPDLSDADYVNKMGLIEEKFPHEKRIYQIKTLQAHLANLLQNQEASLQNLLADLENIQKNVTLTTKSVGFLSTATSSPSLHNALALHVIGKQYNLDASDMVEICNQVIEHKEPKDFSDVIAIASEAIKDSKVDNLLNAHEEIDVSKN